MRLHQRDVSIFIWTEALGCGPILSPMLKSFLTHHRFEIHVIGYSDDLTDLPKSKQIIPITIDDKYELSNMKEVGTCAKELKSSYRLGHNGTATLWASLISTRTETFMIHLDSDTVFLGDVVTPILDCLKEGFNIVGTRRPYRRRLSGSTILSRVQHWFRRDAVNTHAFGFKRHEISYPRNQLIQMINGNSRVRIINKLFPVIDFFDRVTFIISRKGSIWYLDSIDQTPSGSHNRNGDFESKMISFSAVGSGYAFFHGNSISPSKSYEDFAIASYALYAKHLLQDDINAEPLDSEFLLEKLEKLDKRSWTLSKKG